jgi:hypothetical protein
MRDSDVDFLVVMESDERPVARARRVFTVCRSRPFPMDVLVRTPKELAHRLRISDSFFEEILTKGKVLYERA